MAFLSTNKLTVLYGNVLAVDGIDIHVEKKEIVTIIGANGAGKSSTLMSMSGVVKPQSGNIVFDTIDITAYKPEHITRLGIVQVPEGRRIFPRLTVQENLDLGAYGRKDVPEIQEDREYVFGLFPVLRDRAKQMGGTLSGGEQQMLAIARALMQSPKILFLDEPSLGLAPIIVQQIFTIFDKLRVERDMTILLVEQNVNLALKNSDRAYVLENGKIVLEGKSSDLQKDEKVKTVYLGGHAT